MDSRHWCAVAIGAILSCAGVLARADFQSAEAAYANKDFDRAFEGYRELAELGHRPSQENLAVMYVSGEGTRRDNVLGYAWARIAKEQGDSQAVTGIVMQLEPHMNDASRERVEELRSKFGQEALKARLLPIETRPPFEPIRCEFLTPANPDNFFPQAAIKEGLGGNVVIDFTVQPDGRAHSTRVVSTTTPWVFDEAARAALMHSTYKPAQTNGSGTPCNLRVKLKFDTRPSGMPKTEELAAKLPATKARAEAGDPQTQYVYAMVLMNRSELNTANEPIFPWVLKAAQGGVPDAQYVVGVSALGGRSVEQDSAKALIWLEKAAGAGNSRAQLVLANYLVSSRSDASSRVTAAGLLEAAVKSKHFAAMYPLAALLATAPEESIRDPQRAMQLMAEVMPLVDYDPAAHEVRAAAQAWLGDFGAAERHQKIALSRARTLGWDDAPLEARLATYQAQKTWTGNLIAW
jgi:TonB family protein